MTFSEHSQITSIYEVTDDYDVIAVGKFSDTDEMNDQIKALLNDSGVKESNTNVVLNTVSEHEQFELDIQPTTSQNDRLLSAKSKRRAMIRQITVAFGRDTKGFKISNTLSGCGFGGFNAGMGGE